MTKLIPVALLGALLAIPATGQAQLTGKQFACEQTVLLELGQMSRKRGDCITKCVGKKQAKPADYTCSPPFDGLTDACAVGTEQKYLDKIVQKCTGNMPACGGYLKGYCSNDTNVTCDCDLVTSCGSGSCGFGPSCGGRCSTTIALPCSIDADCPGGETCTSAPATKDPLKFAQGNIYDGAPNIVGQIDLFAESLFLCRQKICSATGDRCSNDGHCPGGETCASGNCFTGGAACNYDGECPTPKKACLPRGRCSVSGTTCNIGGGTACPMGETCLRYGRCTDTVTPPGSQSICFTDADCFGETCVRTITQTDRKKELLCTQTVNRTLAKLTFDVFKCEVKCMKERDFQGRGRCQGDTSIKCKLPPDADTCGGAGPCQPTSCDHFAIGRCTGDDDQVCADDSDCSLAGGTCSPTTPVPAAQSLLDCRAKALGKAKFLIDKKCPSLPACGVYSDQGSPVGFLYTSDALLGFVTSAQDGQFKEDNPDLPPGSNICVP